MASAIQTGDSLSFHIALQPEENRDLRDLSYRVNQLIALRNLIFTTTCSLIIAGTICVNANPRLSKAIWWGFLPPSFIALGVIGKKINAFYKEAKKTLKFEGGGNPFNDLWLSSIKNPSPLHP